MTRLVRVSLWLLLALAVTALPAQRASAGHGNGTCVTPSGRNVPCSHGSPPVIRPPPADPDIYRAPRVNPSKVAYDRAYKLAAAGRHQEAIAAYKEVLRLTPGHASSYNNLGVIYSNLGRLRDAIAQYRKAVALRPNKSLYRRNLSNTRNDLSQRRLSRLYDSAFKAKQAGRYHEALRLFRQYVRDRPNSSYGWRELGFTYKSLGRLDEAIAALDRGASLGSGGARRMAGYLRESGDFQRAVSLSGDARVAALRRVIRKHEDMNYRARQKLADTLFALGRLDEAERAFKALRPSQKNYGLRRIKRTRADAHEKRAKRLSRAGKERQAEDAYRQALKVLPGNSYYANKLGNNLLQQGRPAAAAAVYRDGVRRNPKDGVLYYNLALALKRTGRHGEAEISAHKAVALDPDDRRANSLLAQLHDYNTSMLRRLDPVVDKVSGWGRKARDTVTSMVTSIMGEPEQNTGIGPAPEGTARSKPRQRAPGAFGAKIPPSPSVGHARDPDNDWFTIPEPVSEATRKGIDGAKELWERAKTEASGLAKDMGITALTDKLPNGAAIKSWFDEGKMLFKGYKESAVNAFDHAMSGVRAGTATDGPGSPGAEGYDRETERVGRSVQKKAREMAKESIERK